MRTQHLVSMSITIIASSAACRAVDNPAGTAADTTSVSSGVDTGGATQDSSSDGANDTSSASAEGSSDGSSTSNDATNDDATGGDPQDTGSTSDASGSTGAPADQLPPTDGVALRQWLLAGNYLAWTAESAQHPSDGPHGGDVRTFVNDTLLATLDAEANTHEVGAAAVKELYGAGTEIEGWAVTVRVDGGGDGDAWYWYEIIGRSVYADGLGDALCVGCHDDGVDHVLTPYPLQ